MMPPLYQLLPIIAQQYVGTPYQSGLLDQSPAEELVVRLDAFDCMLFVEMMLALARHVQQPQVSLAMHVQSLRYINGVLDGYCSRLHYFSDWVRDNQRRGMVMELTSQWGGKTIRKTLNFMTRQRQAYRPMMRQDLFLCIQKRERTLASVPMTYIPTAEIGRVVPLLQPGDVVAIATAVPNLDVTHTGLILSRRGTVAQLIHASPSGTVRVAADMAAYVRTVPQAIGIRVIRPLDTGAAERE
ncbi:MAG: DUF1460 domain-containing protein [Oscillatoriales cyanobacterium SM2_2_1]|nr:DUF1460 domain-containing protein [Oscillatoriales cyanobacterium SM2_2_1]